MVTLFFCGSRHKPWSHPWSVFIPNGSSLDTNKKIRQFSPPPLLPLIQVTMTFHLDKCNGLLLISRSHFCLCCTDNTAIRKILFNTSPTSLLSFKVKTKVLTKSYKALYDLAPFWPGSLLLSFLAHSNPTSLYTPDSGTWWLFWCFFHHIHLAPFFITFRSLLKYHPRPLLPFPMHDTTYPILLHCLIFLSVALLTWYIF